MSGITEHGRLVFGVEVDGVVHHDFVLRPATLEDEYQAIELIPIPEGAADSPTLNIAYQMRVDDASLLAQLLSLGTLEPAPLPATLLELIDPDDMAVLRVAASALKKKRLQSRIASTPSDSSKPPLSGPAST
ncbi:MAG: hypothetical protein E6R11_07400 [Rhodocyclaceae bacterium]|nr:MAG: hypothetical protein E6R11_07400 [Rhodocyclaceae bacterium]